MPLFECSKSVTTVIRDTVVAQDRQEAFQLFREEYGTPTEIGGAVVVGVCDACNHAVFVGESYVADVDGSTYYCHECCEEIPADEIANMADFSATVVDNPIPESLQG